MLASGNNSKWHPVLRYYCLNVSQLVCNLKKCAIRCSQCGWLVSVDGFNECISNKVRNSGKNEYFPYFVGIFAGVNECSSEQNSCLLWLDLVILWPKVAKNYGVPKIRVFPGLIFGVFSGLK